MNRRIYKYPLRLVAVQSIAINVGAQILSLQMQFNTPTLWAIVNPEQPVEFLTVVIEGTGQEHAELYSKHLGTVQMDGMVWHFFIRP